MHGFCRLLSVDVVRELVWGTKTYTKVSKDGKAGGYRTTLSLIMWGRNMTTNNTQCLGKRCWFIQDLEVVSNTFVLFCWDIFLFCLRFLFVLFLLWGEFFDTLSNGRLKSVFGPGHLCWSFFCVNASWGWGWKCCAFLVRIHTCSNFWTEL